mgnify:FL=1
MMRIEEIECIEVKKMWIIVELEHWFCEDSKECFEDEEMLQRNLDKVNAEVIKQRAYLDSLPNCTSK